MLKISFATPFANSPCSLATRSEVDPMLRSLASPFTSIPHDPDSSRTDPSAIRVLTIGSDSYLPHVKMVSTTPSIDSTSEVEGEEEEWIYELVLRTAVATESRTFLLLDSAHN